LDPRKAKGQPRESIDETLAKLERQLESLKSLFEQFFTGVLKRPPLREHSDFKRSLDQIPPHELKITANKFKLQALKSRHLQLNSLWTKVLNEIELGTYKRDVFLLKNKSRPEAPTSAAPHPNSLTKTGSALDKAYEQFAKLAREKNQKVPSKEKFIRALDQQVSQIKATNPAAKIELKIHQDTDGRLGIKIKKT